MENKKVGKSYFQVKGNYIDFNNSYGIIKAEAEDSIELSKEETKRLFLAMRNYYLSVNDKFWE